MAKQVDELFEAPEAEEQPAKKINQHVVIALRHLNKRRNVLLEKRAAVTKEIEELDAAILLDLNSVYSSARMAASSSSISLVTAARFSRSTPRRLFR